ncbi:hypothetical protein Ancab_016428 [Ancistrocladus abbreviatus]
MVMMPQKKINSSLDLDTCPEFFKVFVPDCSSERLLIPLAFVKQCDAVLPQKVTLLNYTRKMWHVNLEKEDNKLFLKEGWQAFVRENRLEFGDFIVFSYDGNSNFSIKVYGKTGCAKDTVMAGLKCEQPSLHGHEETAGTPRSRRTTDSNLRHRYTIQKECLISSSVNMLKRCRKKNECKVSVDGLNLKSQNSAVSQMKCRERIIGFRSSYRRNISKMDQKLVPEAARKYVPKYPSSMLLMKSSYVKSSAMNMPAKFVFKHFGSNDRDVTLQVEDRLWKVGLNFYSHSCCKLCRGWTAFARDNNLQVGDVCVFEAVNKGDPVLKISIFRCSEQKASTREPPAAVFAKANFRVEGQVEDKETVRSRSVRCLTLSPRIMILHLKPPSSHPLLPYPSFSAFLRSDNNLLLPHRSSKPHHSLSSKTAFPLRLRPIPPPIQCNSTHYTITAAAAADIDMVRTKEGIYAPKQSKVVVLWDLDNKPPRGPPYQAAIALKQVAEMFGEVVDISAYANRHAFIHLPSWVVEERRERRNLDILERKGMVTPSQPYICSVCGRKCKTNLDLKKHFKQLHERERQKKLNRMKQLKGKKRQRFKERYIANNFKYEEAARTLIAPKVGYGLARELRRAGVFVKTVEDKPQAADWAVKRQMMHSMSRGIDWLFLVSDDSDFSEMLRRAREANLGTVVVGDWDRALGRHADLWVPWIRVENGEVSEKDLVPRRRGRDDGEEYFEREDGLFSVSGFDASDDEGDLDKVVDELLITSSSFNGMRVSAFSEGEEEKWMDEGDYEEEGYSGVQFVQSYATADDYLWDIEEGQSDEEGDGYI